jgi:hypothetical protein
LVWVASVGSTMVTLPLPITCNQPSRSNTAQVSSSMPIPKRSGELRSHYQPPIDYGCESVGQRLLRE